MHPAPGLGRLRLMYLRTLHRIVARALAPGVLALSVLVVAPAGAAAADAPLVAAAADLRFALDEIAADFERETGSDVRIVYGSSGNFRRQIAEGAPFELFLSADEAYVLALAREGFMVDDGVAVRDRAARAGGARRARRSSSMATLARSRAPRSPTAACAGSRSPIPSTRRTAARRARRCRRPARGTRSAAASCSARTSRRRRSSRSSGSAQGGIVALSLARSPERAGRGALRRHSGARCTRRSCSGWR